MSSNCEVSKLQSTSHRWTLFWFARNTRVFLLSFVFCFPFRHKIIWVIYWQFWLRLTHNKKCHWMFQLQNFLNEFQFGDSSESGLVEDEVCIETFLTMIQNHFDYPKAQPWRKILLQRFQIKQCQVKHWKLCWRNKTQSFVDKIL